MNGIDSDGFASAQDAARYFGYEAPSEDEYRRIRAERDAVAQDGEVAQAADSSAPAAPAASAFVVLARGRDEVVLPEKDYVEMLAENFMSPTTTGRHIPLVVKWLAQSANKRGLDSLSKARKHLQGDDNGLILVRRPDGSAFAPKSVTTIKVARASEEDHQATATSTDLSDEVAEYLGAAAEADDAPPVRAGRVVGRRRLRPLVRVDVGGVAAPEGM